MKERLNILILGHGARESAIAWKLQQSSRTATLYMAPYGIPGVEGVRIDPLDFDAVARFVGANSIDMVIPGGEGPIVAGIADALSEVDVKVIAPDKAKDYKKIGEGDKGPNTAGMGAVSPVPFVDAEFMEKVERRIIQPTLRGLREEGLDFRGFLFLGLMEQEGEPVLIEYNVRLGDPEAEAILPRIESDIVDVLEGIADRTLALKRLQTSDLCSAAVVLAERGYPGPVDAAKPVEGLNAPDAGYTVFPGEILFTTDNLAFSDGGRVATVEALGASLPEAIGKALAGAGDIHFDGKYFRRDIGFDLLGPSPVIPSADV